MVSQEVVKIFALFLVWCSMGLYLEIPGPTLIDIKLIFNASYEDVSRSVSGRGAGGFTGGLIGGFLVDKFSNSLDLFVGVSETAAALAIMTLPFSSSINTVWFHYFVLGLCGGVINIAGIRSVITTFPKKTAMVLMQLHCGYGVGALLVPLVVNPFLAVIQYASTEGAGAKKTHEEKFTVIKQTHVQSAFVMIGVFTACLSVVFYWYHYKDPARSGYSTVETGPNSRQGSKSSGRNKPEEKRSFLVTINPGTYANGQVKYGCFIVFLMFLYFFNMAGGEEVFGHFVRSFSVQVFNFSKTQASYLNMSFWLGLTIGRVVTSVTARYISTRKLFLSQVVLHMCATTLLNVYAGTSPKMLWVCTFAEGFLISPLYPGGIAYCNTLIEVTGVCLMVITFAGSFGDLTYIWVAGKLYDSYGPHSVLYGLQLVGIILLVITILFRIAERYQKKPSTNMEVIVST